MFPINETMGQYSELFMLLAAGTYTVAFIAFAWDLAKSSKMLRAVDQKAAELSGAAVSRVPVAAGVGASAGAADRTDGHVSGPAGRAERPTSAVSGRLGGRARPPTAACATPGRGAPPPGWPWRSPSSARQSMPPAW